MRALPLLALFLLAACGVDGMPSKPGAPAPPALAGEGPGRP